MRGARISQRDWLKENLIYLEGHRFHTPYALDRFGNQREINLRFLRERLDLPSSKIEPRSLSQERYFDRDLSWLSFNERVLQEAMDPDVPLLERIKFLGIYSNNLDEFYRVRVASLRSLAKLGKGKRNTLDLPTTKLVQQINRKALRQQRAFGKVYREELLPQLARKGIRILDDRALNGTQRKAAKHYFKDKVAPLLHTAAVRPGNAPFIEDRKLYFVCKLRQKGKARIKLVLLNIPSEELGRFMVLPGPKKRTDILFLDDVIRLGLSSFFAGYEIRGCHGVKLSRDAELYLDEEFSGTVLEKVRKSLRKRRTGVPSRFLYDSAMPQNTLLALRELLGLKSADLVAGGHYHNFSDLLKLPVPGRPELRDPVQPPIPHPALVPNTDSFARIKQQDILLHFPYHSMEAVVRILEHAAVDPAVRHMAITLYRVAEGSAICKALIKALENGKRVTVFVEVQARFDERSNIFWGEALEKAGATVLYSHEGLKVHAKLCLIERIEARRTVQYAYLGTGNFNENTARIYVDQGLLTARPTLTREVAAVFEHLKDPASRLDTTHLMVAPMHLRRRVEALVDKEIEHALNGRPAGVLLKLNSLEDHALIRKLYDASQAGVDVRLIIRGICCIIPDVKGMSEQIEAISIVDRYLEHTRAYVFTNAGTPLVYLSSADWMERNMDRRVEVAFPVEDPRLKQEVLDILDLQWNDSVKSRLLDKGQVNHYVVAPKGTEPIRSQTAIREYLKKKG